MTQLSLDVDVPPSTSVVLTYCGIPGCKCGLPRLPDSGWRSKREQVVAERDANQAAA